MPTAPNRNDGKKGDPIELDGHGRAPVMVARVLRRVDRALLRPRRGVEESAQQNPPEGAAVHLFDVGQQLAHVAVQRLGKQKRKEIIISNPRHHSFKVKQKVSGFSYIILR